MQALQGRRGCKIPVAMAAIALAGAALRLAWLDRATFAFDQAQVSLLALRMARLGQFASVGMSSSLGLPNLPLMVWLCAIPYRFTTDPLLVTGLVALANAAAILGLGDLGRRAWGLRAGLLAAALYALSPWAILFSRSIWAQDLLAPLAVLWAWCALRSREGPRQGRWIGAAVLCAGLAPQIHYAGAALWPATAWLAWRWGWWRRGRRRAALGGLALALAAAVPFVCSIWPERGALLASLAVGGQEWVTDLAGAQRLVHMGIGAHWQALLGEGAPPWVGLPTLIQQVAVWVLAGALMAGVLWMLGRVWPRRAGARQESTSERDGIELALAWALGAPLLFLCHGATVYHHYLLAALPALFLIAAYPAAAEGRLRKAQGARRAWLAPVVAELILAAGLLQGGLYLWAGTTQAGTPPGDAALSWVRQVRAAVDDGAPVVLATDCDDPAVCQLAAVFEAALWGIPERAIDARRVLLLPAGQATSMHLLVAPEVGGVVDEAASLGLVAAWRTIGPYRMATLSTDPAASDLPWEPVEDATLSTGAQLVGWRAERAGQTVTLRTLWQIVGAPAAGQMQQFNHLTVDGERVAGQDFAVSSHAWRTGDWLIARAELAIPEGVATYGLRVGMYDLATFERATILERPDDAERAIVLAP